VKIAQALKMTESAQRMTMDYDAMRKKLYRFERSEAATRGAEPHEKTTRKSKLNAANTEAERVQAAASEFLIGAAAEE